MFGFERESPRVEKPKKPVKVEFDSRDGLDYWYVLYDDGSKSELETLTFSGPDAIRHFRQKKSEELGIDTSDKSMAA